MNILLSTPRSYSIGSYLRSSKLKSPHLPWRKYLNMASATSKTPYVPQDVNQVQELVRNLEEGAKYEGQASKKSFRCKKTTFNVKGLSEDFIINSWRFRDWDYKRPDLPTYARGLFIGTNEYGAHEILIRGYDKFFNVEEVSSTKWQNIKEATKGPYELSLKENGCIIFISGLRDGSLLVCSKHSTGPRKDEISHSIAGEKWIDRQLAALGRTREQLARELRSRNATAVAELCDDDFEEHILPYVGNDAGLYLHGININIPTFSTYPSDLVMKFAEEWGFKKTSLIVYDNVQTTKELLEDIAQTGSYQGRDVEGFVIRCKALKGKSDLYEDWFFKYKFEEPYLMYRQWRECTKALISNRKPLQLRKNVAITEEYLSFAKRKLAENPSIGSAYSRNHGIIKLRNDFLKEKNLKGSDLIKINDEANLEPEETIVLLPVATIGCGKTTIAVSLEHLFDWGVVQNDNITGKGRPYRFAKEVSDLLLKKNVVYADRNNSQRRERAQFFDNISASNPNVKVVALHFTHNIESLENIRQVTRKRVFSRGNNHQTIQAAVDQKNTVNLMEDFIKRFEHLDPFVKPDNRFSAVINLDPTSDSRQNLEIVIKKLHQKYPSIVTRIPSSEELDNAINYAINDYKPMPRNAVGKNKNKLGKNKNGDVAQQKTAVKPKPVEYIGVKLERAQILQVVTSTFESTPSDIKNFWNQLEKSNRVQPEFHVTLIHRASSTTRPDLWKKYNDIYMKERDDSGRSGQKIGECQVMLENIVWDDRLMTVVVRLVDKGWECANQVAHITIGTRDKDIKPKESNELLKRWVENTDPRIMTQLIDEHPVVNGTVTVILSR
ncbi:tRNA ligase 1 [Golovinomyces cichoracearum]|uniref:tRNA ligase n=1 Tax=Golovinomyces cichoracearum TaxID=62708 RepID=A0A420ISK9_9PEZI|nr:tRNA ligase 1 [Golovinomyces cichoracearum]